MKTKDITLIGSLRGVVCTVAVLLTASGALGQNLFVSTYTGDSIYEITPGGVQSTFATGMNYPNGIAFNSAGDLFVANSANNAEPASGSIIEITPAGVQSTFASGVDAQAVAFNSAGTLFEADYRSGNIYEYTPKGVQSTFATGLSFPLAIAFNSACDLFVGNGYGNGSSVITEITPAGVESTFATGLSFPGGLAFNSAGNLFVSSQGNGTISEYTPGGVESIFATTAAGGLNGLAFDSGGDLFAANPSGSIIEITPGGTQSTFATVTGAADGLAIQPVPEPSIYSLFGIAAAGLLVLCHPMRHKYFCI